MCVNSKVLKVLLNFFLFDFDKQKFYNTKFFKKFDDDTSLRKPYMKNAVHEYYENFKYYKNLIWRMLFMNIIKTLYEECCSWILRKLYMKNVVHEYYETLQADCDNRKRL